VLGVAAVTLANGGDNIGVYVPVFTATVTAGLLTYVLVFLLLVALWCLAGQFFASRPLIARTLSRRGHTLLPVVLIVIGLIILVRATPSVFAYLPDPNTARRRNPASLRTGSESKASTVGPL
jgi:cadmium resistance protein CadD (predicted permease)